MSQKHVRALGVVQFMRRPASGAYSIERVYSDITEALGKDIRVQVVRCRFRSVGIWRRIWNVLEARRFATTVNHVTGDVNYLTFLLPRRRTVLTIHDCEVLERSSGIKRWLLWLLWFWLPEKCAARIVTVSEESRRRILQHLHCDPQKLVVIHNPVSADFQYQPRKFNAVRPRILHIGTKANKNLEGLIQAIADLPVTLVIIGHMTPTQYKLLDEYAVDYENLTDLDDGQLRQAYADSDIVAFVSRAEGFGLPIVEAQAVGRPVLTSNIAPMNEVAGAAAVLVDPHSTDSIREGLIRLLGDADLREKLVAAGLKNVERFRVGKVAEAYAVLYREVAKLA